LTPILSESTTLSYFRVEPLNDPLTDPGMKPLAWWLTLAAALCGLGLLALSNWTIVTRSNRHTISFIGWRRLIFIGWMLLLAGCSAIPLFHRFLIGVIERLRGVTAVGRRRTTILIFILATGYLLLTAHLQERDFDMNIQDELMYLVQAQLIAHGHLYLPAHPMADFFQELFIFHTPVYASMYFPGTALLYATTIWFQIPNWFLAAVISGACVALMYRVFAELLDGAAGVLGALLLVACAPFRWTSIMVMSHPLAMLQGLLMFWCYLRWRRAGGGGLGWMVLFGALAGWAAITRPLDAVAWALPPMVCIAIELYRRPRGQQVKAVLLVAAAAAPFIGLQLIFDKGVTGHWLVTPVQAYHHHYFPATFASGGELATVADLPGGLPQFRNYYERFIIPGATQYHKERLLDRFPFAVTHTLPASWLIFFIPLGIVGLVAAGGQRRPAHLALAGVFVLFVLSYMTFMFFAAHYLIVILPTGLFLALLGARQLERWVAAGRWRNYLTCFAALVLVTTSALCLPEVCGKPDDPKVSLEMRDFNRQLPNLERPAVVFFRWQRDGDDPNTLRNPNAWKHEQVYNIDSAWPDDSPVVRAQDLGPRNIELVRYYAQKQPGRIFYQYQQDARQLVRLGSATELRDDPRRLLVPDLQPATKPLSRTEKRAQEDQE
jgi:hypothetical protein